MALIVVFQNVSELAPISDYTVTVLVGDGTPERSQTLYSGRVEGHHRADGWQQLIQRFISHAPLPERP
jgi:hypothetical protein